jgi:hypothetical protein
MRATKRPAAGRWFAASAAAATLVLLVSLLTRGSSGAPSCRGALIPAYVPPRELLELLHRPELPQLLVVNPANGPGERAQDAYRDAVRSAQRERVRVLGYVATGYGARAVADVERDVDRYAAWYGVDGIFLDEVSPSEDRLAHYRALAEHARGDAARLVVLNPGTVPAPGYFGLADVVVTFEGPYAAYAPALGRMPRWLAKVDPERVAHLVYDAGTDEALTAVRGARAAGYVYATPGVQPNPWRTLPPSAEHDRELRALCE